MTSFFLLQLFCLCYTVFPLFYDLFSLFHITCIYFQVHIVLLFFIVSLGPIYKRVSFCIHGNAVAVWCGTCPVFFCVDVRFSSAQGWDAVTVIIILLFTYTGSDFSLCRCFLSLLASGPLWDSGPLRLRASILVYYYLSQIILKYTIYLLSGMSSFSVHSWRILPRARNSRFIGICFSLFKEDSPLTCSHNLWYGQLWSLFFRR